MIQELIDIAVLEDFANGVTRASGMCMSVYSNRGGRVATSNAEHLCDGDLPQLENLPQRLSLKNLPPAHEPPASVAFVSEHGVTWVVVPVYVNRRVVGFVSLGPLREERHRPGSQPAHAEKFADLPVLIRRGDAQAVVVARWASRTLSGWCLNEARLEATAEQLSLLGDIGELLSGEQDLHTVLDRIVAETARVMNLQYCSLHLYDQKTGELSVRAGYNVQESFGPRQTVRRDENPIDDAALDGEVVFIEDCRTDPRVRFGDEAQRLGIVSGLVAGMMYRGEPVGVLRVYADHKKRFRSRHRNLLRAVAAQAAIAVVNARLLEQRLRSATMERQLETAGLLQVRMVRTPPPEHPGVSTAIVFEPSFHVGGDFCDVFVLPDGRLAAVVGDVTGHGMPAALLMASVRGALRASARCIRTLPELMIQLNNQVCRETTSAEFITLLIVAIDTRNGRLHYVNAGHEQPMIWRRGTVQQPSPADLVLGVSPTQAYHEHQLDLESNDFVLLYTDGVVEAISFEDEMFGRHRLLSAIEDYGSLPPDQVLRNIRWDVRRFVGLAEQSDDLTMVGMRISQVGADPSQD